MDLAALIRIVRLPRAALQPSAGAQALLLPTFGANEALFGDKGRISKSVHCSNQTPHHNISAFDRSPESRLDGFAFSFEIAIIRTAILVPCCSKNLRKRCSLDQALLRLCRLGPQFINSAL